MSPFFTLISFMMLTLFVEAQTPQVSFWKFRKPRVVITTVTQTIAAKLCSNAVTVQNRNASNIATSVSSDLTINIDPIPGVTFYSDSYCSDPITSLVITTGSNSATLYYSGSIAGPITFTFTPAAPLYTSVTQAHTISVNGHIWTGLGGNPNWNTGANWSGGVAPGSSNEVLFDETCTANCSPTITANMSVRGVRMAPGYTGTISQGAFTMTVNYRGWVQLGGTFAGGSEAITMSGPLAVIGGIYNSTSNNLIQNATFYVSDSATFNHNSGLVSFRASDFGITPGLSPFNNVTFGSSSSTIQHLNGKTMTVLGDLSFDGTSTNTNIVNTGTILLSGNLSASNIGATGTLVVRLTGKVGGQTITGVSTATFPSLEIAAGTESVTLVGTIKPTAFTATSAGTLTTAGSTLLFERSATIAPGAFRYNDVVFSGHERSYELSGATFYIDGNLTIQTDGTTPFATINNGTLETKGNVLALNEGAGGSAVIKLAGNAAGQSIMGSVVPYYRFPGLIIDSGTHPVTLSGVVNVAGIYSLISVGTWTTTGSTLQFWNDTSITPGNVVYNNVKFAGYQDAYSLNDLTMEVAGDLTFGCTSSSGYPVDSGTFKLHGNLISEDDGCRGSAKVDFVGINDQTVSVVTGGAGRVPLGVVTINKPVGKNLVLTSDVGSWNVSGHVFNVVSGGIEMGGFALWLRNVTLNGNTITRSGGILTVNNVVVGAGTVSAYGGTIAP